MAVEREGRSHRERATQRVLIGMLAVAASLGVATVAGAKRTPCPGGRFVVQDGPLLPGAPDTEVDVVLLGGTPAEADLGVGCGTANLAKPLRLKAGKRGTKVRAIWGDCAGFAGKVRLLGAILDSCGTLKATLRAKGFKRPVDATLSTCGDGFVDTVGGEGCETGVACAGAAVCASDCTCADATTTTTTTLPPGACDPLAVPGGQGCPVGEKCTWIHVSDGPPAIGMVGCAPDGVKNVDDTCSFGPAGDTTGFDDCMAGLVCGNGTCQDVCGFDGSPEAACPAQHNCTRYAGLFATGEDDPIAGVCVPGCDPLTQLKADGMPCGPGQGCYLLTGQTETIAVCAGAGSVGHGTQITGTAFANSCLPGHQPRSRTQGTQEYECGALCKMVDVYQGTNEASEGGESPYTCVSKGAQPPEDGSQGESCRYWWAREPFDGLSPYSNTVGWCFKHAAFLYDTNGDMTPDAVFPRCITLTTGDLVPPIQNPPGNDALYFWCQALPAPFTLVGSPVGPERSIRLDQLRPVLR